MLELDYSHNPDLTGVPSDPAITPSIIAINIWVGDPWLGIISRQHV